MEKFPQDVRIAEEKTGGDPDIIESEEFQPEQKPNIANIFGDQTPKMKKGVGRGRRKATPSDEDLTYSRTKVINKKIFVECQKQCVNVNCFSFDFCFRIYRWKRRT